MGAGETEIEQGDIGGAYVGIAGGRWRYAGTNSHGYQVCKFRKTGLYGLGRIKPIAGQDPGRDSAQPIKRLQHPQERRVQGWLFARLR